MTSALSQSCTEKIFMLNCLINSVVSSTKKEFEGKRGDTAREKATVRTLLSLMLGRVATAGEVDLARRETWPQSVNKKDCCTNKLSAQSLKEASQIYIKKALKANYVKQS